MSKEFYNGKNKISKENAIKIFEQILTKFEIAEFEKEDASLFINKIMFGRLYIENEKVIYCLQKSINQGNGLENKFTLDSPEQSMFTDNDIDLIGVLHAYESGNIEGIEKNSLAKIACIFIGLQPDFSEKLNMKDCVSLFMMGSNLFFGS